jgi:hypothetical protein
MLRAMFFGFWVGVVASPHLQDLAVDGGASLFEQMQTVLHVDAYEKISRALSHS